MKIKTISRSADTFLPVRVDEIARLPRNLDPSMHPFERAREYTRALNATKMERMFAQPFVGQIGNGHIDGVYSIAKDMRSLERVATGSGDGMIKIWDMSQRSELSQMQAHDGIVRGMATTLDGSVLSCSSDKSIKLWNGNSFFGRTKSDKSIEPTMTYVGSSSFNSIDHHQEESKFVTAGDVVQLWDTNRSKPLSSFSWGADSTTTIRFNRTETSIFASAGSDRSIVVYDLRTASPIQKLISTLSINAIAWNPMEAFNFAAASEDHNVYLYDMRKMDRALNIYKDHVAAVLDVDFSPTGQELVTGSYDRTIRIFKTLEGHSRDIYHTKRMQRVFCVRYSMDSKYIISGSDDGNVRLWRSKASERTGIKSAKQRAQLEYSDALKERFKHMPEIKRISRHRHVPKSIKTASHIKRVQLDALKTREDNKRRHSKKGSIPYESERSKQIVNVANKKEKSK